MRSAAILAVLLATGCADKAVELRLVLPTNDDASMDISCVTTVHVVLHTGSPDFSTLPQQCIEVDSPASFADLQAQIRGKFELDLPEDLVAVEIRGLTGASAALCGVGLDVFYGADEYAGQAQVDVRLEGAMDCASYQTTGEIKVRPIDFLALATTPAGTAPVCEPASTAKLELGLIRPTNISLPELGFPTSFMEYGPNADVVAGVATLPAWGSPMPTSCLSVAPFEDYAASVIYPANPTICGQAGEIEVPILDGETSLDSIDDAIFQDFPVLVYGLVYDSVTKRPVAGAKVEMDPERAVVVYANPTGNRFEPIADGVTNASGAFLAYMREPSVATVTQGASTKKMRLGGLTGGGSAVIVPLR